MFPKKVVRVTDKASGGWWGENRLTTGGDIHKGMKERQAKVTDGFLKDDLISYICSKTYKGYKALVHPFSYSRSQKSYAESRRGNGNLFYNGGTKTYEVD